MTLSGPLAPVAIGEINAARARLADIASRTPLVRLDVDDALPEIWLKLENLQPIGSFKLRGAGNAMLSEGSRALARGVYTASAGNMAQGVAFVARRLGVPCTVVVPDRAPRAKLDAAERLGARVVEVTFDEWWQVMLDHGHREIDGLFVHPVSDPRVVAGNAAIGLEIVEDLPGVDAVVVPYGGGGLGCGIASALRAAKPAARVIASEIETAAPLAASLAAGEPTEIEHVASFVDGIGGKGLMPEMWPMTKELIAESVVVSLEETARAVRLLARRHRVIAEGAGATSVAAALTGRAGTGRLVCVVSGGNIDVSTLTTILAGGIP